MSEEDVLNLSPSESDKFILKRAPVSSGSMNTNVDRGAKIQEVTNPSSLVAVMRTLAAKVEELQQESVSCHR